MLNMLNEMATRSSGHPSKHKKYVGPTLYKCYTNVSRFWDSPNRGRGGASPASLYTDLAYYHDYMLLLCYRCSDCCFSVSCNNNDIVS